MEEAGYNINEKEFKQISKWGCGKSLKNDNFSTFSNPTLGVWELG